MDSIPVRTEWCSVFTTPMAPMPSQWLQRVPSLQTTTTTNGTFPATTIATGVPRSSTKHLSPRRTTQGPCVCPTVESSERGVSYERGTPVAPCPRPFPRLRPHTHLRATLSLTTPHHIRPPNPLVPTGVRVSTRYTTQLPPPHWPRLTYLPC